MVCEEDISVQAMVLDLEILNFRILGNFEIFYWKKNILKNAFISQNNKIFINNKSQVSNHFKQK